MLSCLAVQLQFFYGRGITAIGVTTNDPEKGPLPQKWEDIDRSNNYWCVRIEHNDWTAYHMGKKKVLKWVVDHSATNTVACQVLKTGELYLYHNGKDVGVVLKGLPSKDLWGFVKLSGCKVDANYLLPVGEAVWCDPVYSECMYKCVYLLIISLNTLHVLS